MPICQLAGGVLDVRAEHVETEKNLSWREELDRVTSWHRHQCSRGRKGEHQQPKDYAHIVGGGLLS